VVNCKAVNDCGMTGISHKIVQVYNPNDNNPNPCDDQPWELKTYPNPIKKGSLTISKLPPPVPCNNLSLKNSSKVVNTVEIYNFYGLLVYQNKFKGNEFSTNKLNLKKGHYALHVTSSNGETLRKLITVE